MLTFDFLRSAHIILEELSVMEDKKAFEAALNTLLRGEKGQYPQRILIEVAVALDRSVHAVTLPRDLYGVIYDFETKAYKTMATTGLFSDVIQVLNNRMLVEDGVVAMSQAKFEEISANVHHLSDNDDEEQAAYWRSKVKEFKFNLMNELKSYVSATQEAALASADEFSSASSKLMNKLLAQKQAAEAQQELLISLHNDKSAGLQDIESIDKGLLIDFLREAAAGSNSVVFSRRLRAMIDRCLPLKTFYEPYHELQSSTGHHWRGLQEIMKSFSQESMITLDNSQRLIDDLIDVMDFRNLPKSMDIRNLVMPLILQTKNVFEAMAAHTDTWLHDIREEIKKLNSSLHQVDEFIKL